MSAMRIGKPQLAPHIGENSYEILESWGKTEDEAKALLEQWGAKNI